MALTPAYLDDPVVKEALRKLKEGLDLTSNERSLIANSVANRVRELSGQRPVALMGEPRGDTCEYSPRDWLGGE